VSCEFPRPRPGRPAAARPDTTDRFYRSGFVSALDAPVFDLPPWPDRPAPPPRDRSPTVPPGDVVSVFDAAAGSGGDLYVRTAADVPEVVRLVAERLRPGPQPVTVVAADEPLMRRTRVALELLVTRQELSEDRYHAVRLVYATPQASAPPAAASQAAASGGDDDDFLAPHVVSGGDDFLAPPAASSGGEADVGDDADSDPVFPWPKEAGRGGG